MVLDVIIDEVEYCRQSEMFSGVMGKEREIHRVVDIDRGQRGGCVYLK